MFGDYFCGWWVVGRGQQIIINPERLHLNIFRQTFTHCTTKKPPQLNYGGFISIFIHSPKP